MLWSRGGAWYHKGGCCLPCTQHPPPQHHISEYGLRVAATHPTGMHSCNNMNCRVFSKCVTMTNPLYLECVYQCVKRGPFTNHLKAGFATIKLIALESQVGNVKLCYSSCTF